MRKIKILHGNCIDKIKELDDNSIDCVVSSPPYFGLRDYGTAQWKGGLIVSCLLEILEVVLR
jgi:DNA modification methylase